MPPVPASAEVIIVGAGPVGLWTASQIKKRNPALSVLLYESKREYICSHVLKLEHFSMLILLIAALVSSQKDLGIMDLLRELLMGPIIRRA